MSHRNVDHWIPHLGVTRTAISTEMMKEFDFLFYNTYDNMITAIIVFVVVVAIDQL